MVVEVECPHCHAKVVPKSRFSTSAFATMLILGVLPFILNIVSYALMFDVLRLLPKIIPTAPPEPLPPILLPPEVKMILERSVISLGLLSVSYLILSLIVGVIPAVVYLAFRRGSYKCPTCNLPIS